MSDPSTLDPAGRCFRHLCDHSIRGSSIRQSGGLLTRRLWVRVPPPERGWGLFTQVGNCWERHLEDHNTKPGRVGVLPVASSRIRG